MSSPASQFCSAPTDTEYDVIERQISTFDELTELKEQFIIKKHTFKQQYASMYYIRLNKLRQAILDAAHEKWKALSEKPKYVEKILDVQPGVLCYAVGTVYLEMPSKPNVMLDLEDDETITKTDTPLKYKSENDVFSLEDESGRVEISGPFLESEFLVTGMVVGVLGKEVSAGVFEVIDICLPGMADQDPLPEHDKTDPKYVALLSGLNIGADDQLDMRTQLLAEFLGGELGSSADEVSSSKISRVILAGNSIIKPATKKEIKKKKYGYDASAFNATPMLQFDEMLEDICTSVDVDIMPGLNDPATSHLPQQPLHPSMFQNAHRLSTFHSVTNPYWCKIDDIMFLGTSGQNIDDLYRYVNSTDRIKLAEMCMFWRHMAPSAPDTLWSYPFQSIDPFIIDKTPHVYFIGNQPQFEDHLLYGPDGQKVRIVLVPSFKDTGILVLVNLSTLECSAVHISDNGIKPVNNDDDMDETM